jgi:hypothetical protein
MDFTESSALPVELLYFNAYAEGEHNVIEWATAMELDNEFFEVQRSTDAIGFETIRRVAGAGHSQERRDYRVRDTGARGSFYYRLRQVDLDGTATLSDWVYVRRQDEERKVPLELFPNPVHDRATVRLPAAGMLRVYGPGGRLLRHYAEVDGSRELFFDDLPAGNYWLQFIDKHNGTTQSIQFSRH